MIGNQIDLYFHGGPQPDDRRRHHHHPLGLPGGADGLLHVDDPQILEGAGGVSQAVATPAATKEFTLWQRVHGWITNPWGKPRFLVLITWGYMRVGDRAGADRDPVLVQQQPLAHGLARLHHQVVLLRPDRLDLAQRLLPRRAQPEPEAGGARRADRDPDRRDAGAGPGPLARTRLRRLQLPDAVPAGHARDRDGRLAAAAVHAAVHVREHRHAGPGARARHVLDQLRGGDRARPAVLDRQVVRGGGSRPGRVAGRGAVAGADAAAACRRSWPARRSCSRSRSTTS